ncbi:hypothetical protein D3C77_722070 [compost metagenome]
MGVGVSDQERRAAGLGLLDNYHGGFGHHAVGLAGAGVGKEEQCGQQRARNKVT